MGVRKPHRVKIEREPRSAQAIDADDVELELVHDEVRAHLYERSRRVQDPETQNWLSVSYWVCSVPWDTIVSPGYLFTNLADQATYSVDSVEPRTRNAAKHADINLIMKAH